MEGLVFHQQLEYPLVLTNSLLLRMAIEMVSFHRNRMVILRGYLRFPEGTSGKRESLCDLRICRNISCKLLKSMGES